MNHYDTSADFNEEREGVELDKMEYVAKFDGNFTDIIQKIMNKYKRKNLNYGNETLIVLDCYNGAEHS